MSNETRATVRAWVVRDSGSVERTAQWMARVLRVGTLIECRELVRIALY